QAPGLGQLRQDRHRLGHRERQVHPEDGRPRGHRHLRRLPARRPRHHLELRQDPPPVERPQMTTGVLVMRALVPLLLCATFAHAAAPPAKAPAEWLAWIDDLGDEQKRDAAVKKLEALGEDVLPALRRAGREHADPDVRLRAVFTASVIEKKVYGEVRRYAGHTAGGGGFALSPARQPLGAPARELG